MIENKQSVTWPRNRIAPSLGTLDGKRVAVVILRDSRQIVLRGLAECVKIRRERLLRIEVDQTEGQGSPVFLIKENQWRGSIAPDKTFGCDFQVQISATN